MLAWCFKDTFKKEDISANPVFYLEEWAPKNQGRKRNEVFLNPWLGGGDSSPAQMVPENSHNLPAHLIRPMALQLVLHAEFSRFHTGTNGMRSFLVYTVYNYD